MNSRNPLHRFLPLPLCLALACVATWSGAAAAKPRKKVDPSAAGEDPPMPGDDGATESGDGGGKQKPERLSPSGPNWGSKPVKAGRVEAAAPMIKVVGMKKMATEEKLYVVTDEYNGVLAELVARKVSRKRTMAQCEIVALRPKFSKNELIGKPVLREADVRGYLKRFGVGSLEGSGGGGGGSAGHDRNPIGLVGLRSESYRSAAFDVMTGADLRQEVETLGGELELFLPVTAPDSIVNWFGLRVTILKAQKGELVGRSADAKEVARFKMEGASQKIQLAVRPTFASRVPSRAALLITLSETRTEKLTSKEATGLGNPGDLTLESTTKGSGAYLGGALSPFDGFHLGLGVDVPVGHQLTIKESGDGAPPDDVKGTWSRLEVEGWGGVRWPRPSGQGGVALDMRAGLTYRTDTVKLEVEGAGQKSYKDIMKWVALGVGYVP